MKKVVLGMMAIAISFASIAQSESIKHKGHQKGANKEFRGKGDRGFENMNLSDAQKTQLKTINENFRNQMRSLGGNNTSSLEEQKSKREALRKEHRSQILAILTPEQKKQWEEKKKQYEMKNKDGKRSSRGDKSWKQQS